MMTKSLFTLESFSSTRARNRSSRRSSSSSLEVPMIDDLCVCVLTMNWN
jgi:hypothetical protein